MTPLSAYQQQSLVHWTRIDMLLALYDKTIEHCQLCLTSNDGAIDHFHRLRAMRLVMHLRSGVNVELGELPQRVAQLLEFVHHNLIAGQPQSITDAAGILNTLRDAYRGIHATALELESRGEIPPVDVETSVERLA